MRSGHHSPASTKRYADAIAPDRKESPAWQAWIEKQRATEQAAQARRQNSLLVADVMEGAK